MPRFSFKVAPGVWMHVGGRRRRRRRQRAPSEPLSKEEKIAFLSPALVIFVVLWQVVGMSYIAALAIGIGGGFLIGLVGLIVWMVRSDSTYNVTCPHCSKEVSVRMGTSVGCPQCGGRIKVTPQGPGAAG